MIRCWIPTVVLAAFLAGCGPAGSPVEGEWTYGPISTAQGLGESSMKIRFEGERVQFILPDSQEGNSGMFRMDGGDVMMTIDGVELNYVKSKSFNGYECAENSSAFYR